MKLSLFLLLLLNCLLFSQTISSVEGSFENGNSITINGNGFGAKSSAAPLISSYDNPTSANNFSGGSIGGSWETSGTVNLINSSPRTSFYQSSYKARYDQAGDYKSLRYVHVNRDDHLYISFWIYRDYSPWSIVSGSGNNSKFLRIYTDGSGNLTNMGASGDNIGVGGGTWSIAYSACNAFKYSSVAWNVETSSCLHQLRQWTHCEYIIDYPSALSVWDGVWTTIYNGATAYRCTNISMNDVGQTNDRRWVLIGHVSGGRSSTGYEYLDQVYIDNTWARVFISDASNITSSTDYGSANHREVQVCSSWSNNQITFQLNQGEFTNGETAYVYVVTPNGNISNARQITFGSSANNPQTPSGLLVSP